MVNGQPAKIECLEINGQVYLITRGAHTVLSLEDEWYEDVKDPALVIQALADSKFKPDIFTFWQRVPDFEPKYKYAMELESIAALPITTTEDWFAKSISSRLRGQIRKATKEGLEIREIAYDDDFVRGITAIFNEAPVRQGRKFWHYGKDFETVKKQFARFIHREYIIGAYLKGELVGFIMLGHDGRVGITMQILSTIKNRDKVTNNALIGKAVELCVKYKLSYLHYLYWTNDSLAEFKRRCGFTEYKLPRYYVPLTAKGKLLMQTGLHRGLGAVLPKSIKEPLRKLRRMWLER